MVAFSDREGARRRGGEPAALDRSVGVAAATRYLERTAEPPGLWGLTVVQVALAVALGIVVAAVVVNRLVELGVLVVR